MGKISELIGIPLGWVMYLIYQLVKNYGISIAIFTVIVRMLMFPISVKQQKSTAAMAAFSPKLEKLKKQYANNPNKLQEEQMKLYSEEGINPMASCLPMFLQLFLLYGVFDVVYRPMTHILRISNDVLLKLKEITAAIEINGVPVYAENNLKTRPELFIVDAMKNYPEAFSEFPDALSKINEFDNMLFGSINLGSIPNTVFAEGTVWNAGTVGLMLIPIISGVIQLAMTIYSTQKQKKLNPSAAQQMGSMNIMMYGMVLFSVWMAYSFPAGIGFYWIMSSLVGFLQNIILNKVYTPEYVAKLIEKDKAKRKKNNKPGLMEKYNEMIKEQMDKNNAAEAAVQRNRIASSGIKKDEDGNDIKLSKSQAKEYERKIIAEARRRQAEKYGDEYIDDDKS
ncbi:MAG: YidC/Oxa1 family membrane protein insertase [Huintestinicola sp.]